MISLYQVYANSMPATLLLKTERLHGVAVDAALNDAVGAGPRHGRCRRHQRRSRDQRENRRDRIAYVAETAT